MPTHTVRRFLALLLTLTVLLAALPALALEVQSVALQRAPGGGEQVAITMDLPVTPRLLELQNPPRLVLDFPVLQWRAGATDWSGGIVSSMRHARFDADTTRLVLDLARPVPSPRVELVQQSGRYTLLVTFAGAPSPAEPRQPPPIPPDTVPVSIPPAASVFPVPREKPSGLNAAKPLIAIDAGHGGRDPGAIGPSGLQEKRITLTFAQALKQALEASGRYRAMLVREDDRIIALRQRPAIARAAGADLFLSLHADSVPGTSARGVSIYTLSNDASDQEAAALARQENKADIIAGIDLTAADADVTNILIDLAQRDTNQRSVQLAEAMLAGLREAGVPLHKRPRSAAGFAVLKAPDTPSALVELGFISHPDEERALQQPAHRNRITDGLVAGLDRFFRQYR